MTEQGQAQPHNFCLKTGSVTEMSLSVWITRHHGGKAHCSRVRNTVFHGLRLKPQHDAEALVVAHEPGQGKYQGMLGAIVVMTPEGRRFRHGTGFSDAQRQHPPAIGSTVTYRYRDFTSTGLPRFASFLRVRERE